MNRWIAVLVLLGACSSQTGPAPRHGAPPLRTIDGEVIRVTSDSARDGSESGVRIVVQPGAAKPVDVALAPGWYLDEHGLRFEPGDRVQVAGGASGEVFVASDVSKGARKLRLRDAAGRPLWADPAPAPKEP